MRAVVFDLDGTLVNSAPDIAWGINRMLADYGLPAQDVHAIEQLTGEGANVLVAKVYQRLGKRVNDHRIESDTAAYLAYYRTRPAAESMLYADALETLPLLRRAGFRLAVCTNKVQALAQVVLDHFEIGRWMDIVVGSDTTPNRKPHPEPLLHTLNTLGVAPADAIFVGDTAIDRDCAAAAGVQCRIVGWGTGPAVAMSAADRLYRFSDLLPLAATVG